METLMRLTQGCFSYLPDLTREQLTLIINYGVSRGMGVALEYTQDPHPRNSYWYMWGLPKFSEVDAMVILHEIAACKEAYPDYYIRLNFYDGRLGVESCALSCLVARPGFEPGFRLIRQEGAGRRIVYTLESIAVGSNSPEGDRY